MKSSTVDIATTFMSGTIILSIPLLFSALGETYAERGGVLNLGLEGIMIMGAFFGLWGAYISSNPLVGLLVAVTAGASISLVFGYLCIRNTGDQVVAGIAIWILGLGLTSFLNSIIFPIQAIPPSISGFPSIAIPVLSQIPVIGPSLFNLDILSYLALLLIPIGYFILYKTKVGLHIRAVGEDPRAAESVGLSAFRIRYSVVILDGVLTSVAGFFLVTSTHVFFPGMTAGRGFIAIAIVVLGRWSPAGVLIGSLIFGGALETQFMVQPLGLGIPYEFVLMLPYMATVVALIASSKGSGAPASLAKPYKRQ